jgi:malate synthase
MMVPFLEAYSELLIDTCHKRGCHAMGGMAAQIPVRGDSQAHAAAMNKVRMDKLHEVLRGHDGTWVAHPSLVSIAQEMFDKYMEGPSQISRRTGKSNELEVKLDCFLTRPPIGIITAAGLKQNVEVGVLYLAAWLEGKGCVPLYNLMEDAATAEISRTQVWQWIRYGAATAEGDPITRKRLQLELDNVLSDYNSPRLLEATKLFMELCTAKELPEFLTIPAYTRITSS